MLKNYAKDLIVSQYKRKQFKATILFVAGVVVFTVIAGFLFRQSPARPPAGRMEIASDFPAGTWFNVSEPLSLFMQLKGHVVVVLFNDFNTLADLEDLSRLCSIDSTFSDKPVACVIISAGADSAMASSIVDQWQIHFPVLADPDHEAMSSFGVRALPAVLVIDTASRISSRYYEDWNLVRLEDVIQDLISQGEATKSLASEKYIPESTESN